MSTPLWALDATELARRIRAGLVSSREAVTACLARMDAVNPKINAVVRRMDEEALAAADAADARLHSGATPGPLHGVPVTIKVNIDQKGHPTDGGVIAYKDLIAQEDNPVVAHFRSAGAIIIGRTNTPCYSMRWFTANALHGATLNPWNAAITPGGSSGGAGAAVAAGIGPIAHGNDIAGSVRYPAYCCGLVGMRPSYGRVPSYNATATRPSVIASQLMAVQGPLTRTVRDNRLALAVMAQPDARDPRYIPVGALPPPSRPRHAALVPEPEGRRTHPAIAAAIREAGRRLQAAGWVVEEIAPPRLIEAAELWPQIGMPDVMAQLAPLVEQNGDDAIRRNFALTRAIWGEPKAERALAGLATRLAILKDWQIFLESWPVVVMPVCCAPPYPVDHDLKDVETARAIAAEQAPTLAISVLGVPGLAMPIALHEGVPIGVQIVAGRFREDLCYDAAEIIEAHGTPATPLDPRA